MACRRLVVFVGCNTFDSVLRVPFLISVRTLPRPLCFVNPLFNACFWRVLWYRSGMSKSSHPKEPGKAVFDYFNHPLVWLDAFAMPSLLYPWQLDIINNAAQPRSRVCVSTCNEAGKTAVLVPLLGLSIMVAFPGAVIFSTAGVESQLRDQLFPHLEAKTRPYTNAKTGWSISTSDLVLRGPKVNGIQSMWSSRCARDSNTLEGFHSKWIKDDLGIWHYAPVCVIIDEAKSVEEQVFLAAYRIDPDFLFVVSTPGEDSGPFFNAMEEIIKSGKSGGHRDSKDGLWTYRRKVSWLEVPHLRTPEKLAIREALTRKYGANSSFIKSFLGGEFKRDSDENYVFTDHDVAEIRECMSNKYKHVQGKVLAALEFSAGGDEQVIMIADGNKVILDEAYREEDTAKLAKIFVDTLTQYKVKPRDCTADGGGIGHAIIYNMEMLGYRPISWYMNNQEALNKQEFADRMSEDHYGFKDKVHDNKIILPNDPKLLRQIRQRKAYPDEHNRVKLELKKKHRPRTGESPDRLDTCIMLFANWSMPRPVEKVEPEYRSKLLAAAQERSGTGGGSFGWLKDHKQANLANTVIHEMAKIKR